MQITITEVFETVGWKEGEAGAPPEAVTIARKNSEAGVPTAFAKLKADDTWAVITSGQAPTVVYRQTKNVEA